MSQIALLDNPADWNSADAGELYAGFIDYVAAVEAQVVVAAASCTCANQRVNL